MTSTPHTARPALAGIALFAATVVGCGSGGGQRPPGSAAASPSPLTTRWRWVAPPPSYVGAPGADATAAAATFGHSHLVVLDAGGRVRWTADRGRLREVAPLLTPAAVVAAGEEEVVAFDRADGSLRWAAEVGERANSPAISGAMVVVSTWEGSLVGIDAVSGTVAWRHRLPGPALGPAAATGTGTVVASWEGDHGDGAGVVAVDAATGRERWAVPVPPSGVSGPGVVRPPSGAPVVVVVAGDIAAHGLDAESGSERWRTELEGAGEPEVVPLDAGRGLALVAHRLGGMALLDAGSGTQRWAVSSDGAAVEAGPAGPGPAGRFALPLDDGRLLVAGPGRTTLTLDPPGRVRGVATGPDQVLLVGTREATDNDLTASSGW